MGIGNAVEITDDDDKTYICCSPLEGTRDKNPFITAVIHKHNPHKYGSNENVLRGKQRNRACVMYTL